MFDLETLGVRPGSAIRSVGAAAFDPAGGEPVATFSRNIRSLSCWVAGLTVDRSTLDWWDRQSQEARDAVKVDPVDLADAARDFHAWFGAQGAVHLWCQGAGFDEVLWTAAMRAIDLIPPWKFWDVRCTRTIYHAAGLDPRSVPRQGVAHSALDDALHQIRCVQEAHRRLLRGEQKR